MRAVVLSMVLAGCAGSASSSADPRAPTERVSGATRPAIVGSSPRTSSAAATAVPSPRPRPQCTWTTVAALPVGRRWHAAVVLADGRVLVAGGAGARTDVYDPARDTWREVGAMSEPRDGNTLTRLADGRVLVVGGTTTPVNGNGRTATTTEIFDPREDRWTTAGPPVQSRHRHTATLLRDGRVLVTGGTAVVGALGPQLASTEIFDPRTNAWSPGPALAHARQLHTATRLRDGRVIVIGGQIWGSERAELPAEVEVVDVARGSSAVVTRIPEPRSGHTTTVLSDGRLLVTGGWSREHGRTLLVDLYDASTDRWSEAGELAVGRDLHAAVTLSDGRVVVTGGETNGSLLRGLRDSIVEIYDPRTDRWDRPENVPIPRMEHSIVNLADGDVLVFGGVDSHYDPPLTQVERGRCR